MRMKSDRSERCSLAPAQSLAVFVESLPREQDRLALLERFARKVVELHDLLPATALPELAGGDPEEGVARLDGVLLLARGHLGRFLVGLHAGRERRAGGADLGGLARDLGPRKDERQARAQL